MSTKVTENPDRNLSQPTSRSNTRARGCLKYSLLAFLAIPTILVLTGVAYQAVGTAQDARRYPPPGELFHVGDQHLHLNCQGEGSPTIILETLHGGTSANWAWIQPELAKTTRVCSYDRLGRGWSDPGIAALDLWETANTLHELLHNAQVEGPYLLVGHSIGGLYVRAYASRYPDEVAGIALLDSSHPEQFDRHPEFRDASFERLAATFPTFARVGLFRLYFATGGEIDFQDLPPQQHAELVAFWSSPAYHQSARSESRLSPLIFEQAHDLPNLQDLPLTVISAENGLPGWEALQSELAGLSTNSQHVTVPGSSHASLAFNREHAHQVSQAILQLLERAAE